MTNSILVLQNKNGETARVIPFTGENLEVIYRHDTRRVEVVRDTKELTQEKIEFTSLGEVDKKSAVGDVVVKGTWGQLRHVAAVAKTTADVQETKDDEKRDFFFFLKWTSGVQIAALLLVFLAGYLIARFAEQNPEPQVVKVFKQEDIRQKAPVVSVSEKKLAQVKMNQIFKRKTTSPVKKVAVRTSGKTTGNNQRSGTELSNMGALSAFGGMSKNSSGLGGLSAQPSKSSGFAFDKSRQSGGSNRGLLGKGLIQAGIGGGETLQGYGGYGTSGKGQGQAAYGVMGRAGSSGGYYLPMSEDASIEGGLDRDQVNAVVFRNFMQVRYCYETGLQSQSKLSGRVAVKFIIGPSGQVSVANVAHTSLNAAKVESCIIEKLRAWRFPKPRGNVSVKVMYPFDLKRSNQG